MATKKQKPAAPELHTEIASRLRDPFEPLFMGVIRPNDPLLGEYGNNWQMYRDLKRDGKVFAGLQKRVLALISRPWTVQPMDDASQADAKVVQRILEGFNFDALCADLMEALLCGFSPAEVMWTVRDGLVMPERIARRAQRRFVYVQADDSTPPELRLLTRDDMIRGVALPPRKFIVHRVNPEDDNPYGTGLGLQLYWPTFFKRKGVIAWNKLCDRFGTPTPWGKHPRDAGGPEKNTLFAALKAFSNDGVIMTPEGSMIELLESKLTGSVTTHESLCNYMDDWISEVILGQEPRQKGGGALAAASKEREGVRLELTQADSDLLSGTLNATLIAWICEYNGLAPCTVYREIKGEEDKKAESETDVNVYSMGFVPTLDAIRAKYGQGWEVRVADSPENPALPKTAKPVDMERAHFAEPGPATGQQAIDQAVDNLPEEVLQEAMADLIEPLLAAIEAADSYEDALAAVEAAYPRMDSRKLQHLLATAMFSAEAYGRQVET